MAPDATPLPVFLLDASPMFSGAQRMGIRVLQDLRAQGRIHLSAWVQGEAVSRLLDLGVPVYDEPLPFMMPGYADPKQVWTALRGRGALARRAAGAVIYANGIHSGLAAALMGARGMRVHVRDILRPRLPTKLTYQLLHGRGAHLAGVSGPVARNIEDLGGGPAIALYDPAPELGPTRPQAEEVRRIGFVGNLIHFKGPDLLIRAMAMLAPSLRERLTLTVVGPENAGHEDFARSLPGLAQALGVKAEFLGRREDVPALMASFDVAVLPSTWPDPFPGVVLEAAAADTPIVATRVGGVPEMVPDPPDGLPPWLCPHEPTALAAVLTLAVQSSAQERRRRVDANRHHLSTRYASPVILDRTFDFLKNGVPGR